MSNKTRSDLYAKLKSEGVEASEILKQRSTTCKLEFLEGIRSDHYAYPARSHCCGCLGHSSRARALSRSRLPGGCRNPSPVVGPKAVLCSDCGLRGRARGSNP